MSGRRRPGLSPSLFPFLAVLVCTLGTLILLLALVAQNANDAAQQQKANQVSKLVAAASAPTLSAAAAATMIEEARFRVQELVSFRDAQTNEITKRKDELTHLENHITRLREQLKQLSDEVEMATGTKPVDTVEDAKLASLRQQIEDASTSLEKLRAEKSDTTPRVVIVPHKGPNGTDRRPIYIECDAQGVTIQPEGTRISLQELRDSDPSANPLDAALRVIRYHAVNHDRDPISPYPLLIVRPGGIESYSEARAAMRDWDDQFGYELISADLKLAFNKPDPELRQRTDLAVREAVLKQQAKHVIVGIRGNGGGGVASSGRRYPTLSAKSMGRQGTASGFRSSDDSRYQSAPHASNPYTSSGTVDAGATERLDDRLRSNIDELKQEGFSARDAEVNPLAFQPDAKPSTRSNDSLATARLGPYQSGEGLDAAADANHQNLNRSGHQDAPSQMPTQGDSRSANMSRAGMPSASATDSKENPSQPPAAISATNRNPRSMVKREGKNWALPRSVARSHGNAIVRNIRVQCYRDRIVMIPSRASNAAEMFDVTDGDITRATLELATAVRDQVDLWGAAIPGGRWQPRLDVQVMPGGETRYHEIRTLMNGSGVEVQGKAAP